MNAAFIDGWGSEEEDAMQQSARGGWTWLEVVASGCNVVSYDLMANLGYHLKSESRWLNLRLLYLSYWLPTYSKKLRHALDYAP